MSHTHLSFRRRVQPSTIDSADKMGDFIVGMFDIRSISSPHCIRRYDEPVQCRKERCKCYTSVQFFI